jgi:hypothetical protein
MSYYFIAHGLEQPAHHYHSRSPYNICILCRHSINAFTLNQQLCTDRQIAFVTLYLVKH